MSASSNIPISSEFRAKFKECSDNKSVRYFKIVIQNNEVVETFSSPPSSSIQQDFDSLASQAKSASEACYFLFQLEPKNWIFITFVPEKVSVKDKMVYASSKGNIKSTLGFTFFSDDLHFTSLNELSYDYFSKGKAPVDSRSKNELAHEQVLKEEQKERTERAEREIKGTGIGGYHVVTIPLTEKSKNAISKFKAGEINFIELAITEKKDQVDCSKELNTDEKKIWEHIDEKEPRFYLFRYNQTRPSSAISKSVNVFIYSCPSQSFSKLRMVYSTSKPHVVSQISSLGVDLAKKKIEIQDNKEISSELLSLDSTPSFGSNQNSMSSSRFPTSSNSSTSSSISNQAKRNSSPHPIYSLMNQNGSQQPNSNKKKIVIPPSGAWGGY